MTKKGRTYTFCTTQSIFLQVKYIKCHNEKTKQNFFPTESLSSCAQVPRHPIPFMQLCSHIRDGFSWLWQVLHRGNYSQWYIASHCVWTLCHHMLLGCKKKMSSCSYLSFVGTKTKLTTDTVACVNLTMFTWDWDQSIYLLSKPNPVTQMNR